MKRILTPQPGFEERVRTNFALQGFMATLGAELTRVVPGEVRIGLRSGPEFTQQHGFVHAGVVTTLADTACGYAAYTLLPADHEVLTVEFKANLLEPAVGDTIEARAVVLRSGRTLSTCQADVFTRTGEEETKVAILLATIVGRAPRPGGASGRGTGSGR